MEPSVLIVAKCPNGHETQMFPEKCFRVDYSYSEEIGFFIAWDCPVCPRDDYRHEVEICKT